MKIQVLELPTEQLGAFSSTPFVLVLSDVDGEQTEYLSTERTHEALIEVTGARGVLVFSDANVETGGEVPADLRRQVEAVVNTEREQLMQRLRDEIRIEHRGDVAAALGAG